MYFILIGPWFPIVSWTNTSKNALDIQTKLLKFLPTPNRTGAPSFLRTFLGFLNWPRNYNKNWAKVQKRPKPFRDMLVNRWISWSN